MHTKNSNRTSPVLAFTLLATSLAGCSGSDVVKGSAAADKRAQALSIGTVLSVNGNYEDNTCMDPTSGALRTGASWSANISNMPGNDPLVVLNDSGCKLDLVSVSVQDSMGATQTASAAAPFRLLGGYGAPVPFSYTDSGTSQVMQFYGNATVNPADFSANFFMFFIYSDTLDGASSISLTGQYATVGSSSVVNAQIPAPNDTLDFAGVTYVKDAMGIVQSVTNEPTFTLMAPAGDDYKIVDGACPNTLATAGTAYAGGSHVSVNTAPLAADFGLSAGADLTPALRKCMIVGRCADTICSYQLFDVTFN
jgi:hypothetical protein